MIPEHDPSVLVSFVFLPEFLKFREHYRIREWVMDSGAYSAWTKGVSIELEEYADVCLELLGTDPMLTEVFALDVIGDWRASLKNCERLWAKGVPAIPTYHVGEPEDVLLGIARDYPKIALGGAVGYKAKLEWARQCFARVWPKAIHGLGFGMERSVLSLPWHSVDATNWELGPCGFGQWKTFGYLDLRGRSDKNLRAEVDYYLDLERKMRERWQRDMRKVSKELSKTEGGKELARGSIWPQYRLAIWPRRGTLELYKKSLGGQR